MREQTKAAPGSVSLRNLDKSFGAITVIKGMNLEINDGEFVVFVGPSGCGKSTLLRIIAGLEEVGGGDVLIGGKNVTHTRASKRGVAMVFQSYALYPHMSTRQNMEFGLKLSRTPRNVIDERVNRAAEKLDIVELLERRPGQLSGGQRQRVAIGRAIVREPVLFLFDEPLSNLDAELRVGMRMEISRLHRELGNTMIYVTHDQSEAMTLADRIVVLRDGQIEQVGTPRQIYEDPDNIFVAGFIGSPRMNFLSATWLGRGKAEMGGVEIVAPIAGEEMVRGDRVIVGIRPEHLSCDQGGEFEISLRVEASEYLGGTQFIYGQSPGGQSMIAEMDEEMSAAIGKTQVLGARGSQLRFFNADGIRMR